MGIGIGDVIKEARIAKGLTQDELGEMVGLKKSAISKYESGQIVNIKRSTLQKLAIVLGLKGSDLVSDIEELESTDEVKPTADDDDGLSENMLKLIDFAKTVPEEKASLVLQVMKSIVEAE